MSFDLSLLIFISFAYLLALFGVACVTEKGMLPQYIMRHPAIYTLSLGVYASAWALINTVTAFSPITWESAEPFCWPLCCSAQSCALPEPTSCPRWPISLPFAFAAHGQAR